MTALCPDESHDSAADSAAQLNPQPVLELVSKRPWPVQAAVRGRGAATTMAVPNMLEIVPEGINKWVGMRLLLQDLGLSPTHLMSCGDGANDLQLVENSGLGVAMGNAVPQVSIPSPLEAEKCLSCKKMGEIRCCVCSVL